MTHRQWEVRERQCSYFMRSLVAIIRNTGSVGVLKVVETGEEIHGFRRMILPLCSTVCQGRIKCVREIQAAHKCFVTGPHLWLTSLMFFSHYLTAPTFSYAIFIFLLGSSDTCIWLLSYINIGCAPICIHFNS